MQELVYKHRVAARALAWFFLMFAWITLLAGYGLGESTGAEMAATALIPLAVGVYLLRLLKTE